jgi:hypothetical protein
VSASAVDAMHSIHMREEREALTDEQRHILAGSRSQWRSFPVAQPVPGFSFVAHAARILPFGICYCHGSLPTAPMGPY